MPVFEQGIPALVFGPIVVQVAGLAEVREVSRPLVRRVVIAMPGGQAPARGSDGIRCACGIAIPIRLIRNETAVRFS